MKKERKTKSVKGQDGVSFTRDSKGKGNLMWPAKTKVMRARELRRTEQRKETDALLIL